jgi:DDE_Tnp_1-associated
MVTYPLDETLLATLVGDLRGADDWDAIELLSREYVAWLKQFLPYENGVAKAKTFRKVFRLLKRQVLNECFGAWVSSLQDVVRDVVAIDGKTLRGSKKWASLRQAQAPLMQSRRVGLRNHLEALRGCFFPNECQAYLAQDMVRHKIILL